MIISDHFPTGTLELKYHCSSSRFGAFEQKCGLFPRTKIRARPEAQLMPEGQCSKCSIRTLKLYICLFGYNWSDASKISYSLSRLGFSFVCEKCKGRYHHTRPFSDKYPRTQMLVVKLLIKTAISDPTSRDQNKVSVVEAETTIQCTISTKSHPVGRCRVDNEDVRVKILWDLQWANVIFHELIV